MGNKYGVTVAFAKAVHDFILCGREEAVGKLVVRLGQQFELGTVCHGPRTLLFFVLNIIQHDDYTISIDGDDKLMALVTYPSSRVQSSKSCLHLLRAQSAGSELLCRHLMLYSQARSSK